jgi:hypothetical protein
MDDLDLRVRRLVARLHQALGPIALTDEEIQTVKELRANRPRVVNEEKRQAALKYRARFFEALEAHGKTIEDYADGRVTLEELNLGVLL